MITRWDKWFSDDNLAQDKCILSAPPSQSAENAAWAFLAREKRFILDLACGVGRDTFHLESRGLGVIGVDAAFNGLRVAQRIKAERGAVSELIMADARHPPFKDGSFEGVYCFGLLHEFTGEGKEEDVKGVMGEVKRLLCDEGVLILTVWSSSLSPLALLPVSRKECFMTSPLSRSRVIRLYWTRQLIDLKGGYVHEQEAVSSPGRVWYPVGLSGLRYTS